MPLWIRLQAWLQSQEKERSLRRTRRGNLRENRAKESSQRPSKIKYILRFLSGLNSARWEATKGTRHGKFLALTTGFTTLKLKLKLKNRELDSNAVYLHLHLYKRVCAGAEPVFFSFWVLLAFRLVFEKKRTPEEHRRRTQKNTRRANTPPSFVTSFLLRPTSPPRAVQGPSSPSHPSPTHSYSLTRRRHRAPLPFPRHRRRSRTRPPVKSPLR